jgi:hypothetical protein
MRLLLVEEIQARERLPLLILKNILQKKGFEVRLSNSWKIERDIKKFSPEVVVDNISDSLSHYAGKLYNYKGKNINLMWEQVISPYNIHRLRFDESFVENFVEGRVSWGDSFKSIFSTLNQLEDDNRIGICGSMNHSLLDMLKKKGVDKGEIGKLYGLNFNNYEKIVVIADTFKAANSEIVKKNSAHPFIKEISLMHTMYQNYLPQLCAMLAKKFTDTLFVVRAHPHKGGAYYNDFKGKFSNKSLENVIVQFGGSISMLLGVSDVVISHKSGVLADASYVGTKAINLVMKNDVFEKYKILPHPVDEYGVHADELTIVDILSDMLYSSKYDASHEINESEIFGEANENTFEKVSNFVEKISCMEKKPNKYHMKDLNYPLIKRIARNRVRYLLGYHKNIKDDFNYDRAFEILKND